jgi:HAD superfamily hydrolase (TIGR01509 family)
MHPRRAWRGQAVSPLTHVPPGGVVFDCDGVLADTTSCWEEAFCAAARVCGLALGPGQLAELRGAALRTAAGHIVAWSPCSLALDGVIEVLRERLVASIDASPLTLIDGVRDLLASLHGCARLGVASNSPRPVLLRVLARLDITHYFATAISADDVARPKPAPDPYLAACRALGVDPRLSFAIEDSQIGIRSATAAGLAVIELAGSAASGPESPPGALRVRSLTDRRIRPLLLGSASR